MNRGKLLSIRGAARQLGVDFETLRKAIERGQVRAVQLGDRLRIPAAEVERLLAPGTTQIGTAKRVGGGQIEGKEM